MSEQLSLSWSPDLEPALVVRWRLGVLTARSPGWRLTTGLERRPWWAAYRDWPSLLAVWPYEGEGARLRVRVRT